MMKYIRGLFALILMIGLTACGGGGGSPGSTSSAKLFTTASDKITISPGATQTFTVGGGVPGYTASSSNAAVAVSLANNVLTIKAGGGGTATVTVKDNSGAVVLIDITIGSGLNLFTTAPSDVTVALGAQTAEYTIGGGSLIYDVTSSNNAVAAVKVNGNRFVIVGVAGGKASVSVRDSVGGIVNINVVVGSTDALFTTAATEINVGMGAAVTYTVGGGSPAYSVGSSNTAVATASITDNKLTITGISVGVANIVVHDAVVGSVPIKVTVGSTAELFTSAPTDLVVGIGTSSPTFTIGGGSQVYTATSSNPQIASVGINGNKFTVSGIIAGSAVVTIKDSLGKTVLVNVKIGAGAAFYTTAPLDLVLTGGGSGSYVVGGGVAPYTATSSNTAVVNASISGNALTLTGVGSGKAPVILRDAAGAVITVNVTLGSGTASKVFTTAPSAVTIALGSSPSYQIGGGTAPYSVSSSNTAVATVTLAATGSSFSITAVATGTANIVVKDATGDTVTITVSIGSGASVDLYTSAPASVFIAPGASPVYAVGGGTAPYLATSSDVKVATVSVSGSSMTITGVTTGTAVVRLVDSVGKTININVTVVAATSSDLIVSPTSITAYVGDILSIRVDGGTAPYTAISNNPAVATITNGSVLSSAGTVTVFLAKALTEGVAVVISDSNGISKTVNISVKPAAVSLTLSPTNWSINETNNASVNLTITGGSGPFQVFTDTPLLSSVNGSNPDAANPLTFTGRTVNVSLGTQGSRCVAADTIVKITVKDSLNTQADSFMKILNLTTGGC